MSEAAQVLRNAPSLSCVYCRQPMSGKYLKLWGQFFYTCKNPDCPIDEVEVKMKFHRTPAGKFFGAKPPPSPAAPSGGESS